MNKLFYLAVALILSLGSLSQVPGSFNYQAVVRDGSGGILANKQVLVGLSIIQGSVDGTTLYSEEWDIETNALGLINLEVGSGDPVAFSSINWSTGPFYISISVDGEHLGASQLLSVPFAMQADRVINDEVNDADADPTNEIQDLTLSGNELTISGGNTVVLPTSISGTQTLSVSGHQLSISDGNTVTLPDNTNDADADPTNEIELPSQTAGDANKALVADGSGNVSWESAAVDTKLTESEVDDFVANNGYLTAEVDGSTTNEIELPEQVEGDANKVLVADGSGNVSWESAAVDTKLTETEVDDYVSNNGYVTSDILSNVPNPTTDNDAANKKYVDDQIDQQQATEKFKEDVIVVATSSMDVTTPQAVLPSIDGYQLLDGDRVLLIGQFNASENKVWIAKNNAPWVLASDFDSSGEINVGNAVMVEKGTNYQSSIWTISSISSGNITWAKRNDLNNYIGGNGIVISGTSIETDISWIENNLDVSNFIDGVLSVERIPLLDASKITSGEFSVSIIPNLDASKISTGTIPISRGGTGATSQTAAFNSLSPISAAGDLIYGVTDGAGARLAKGSAGQVLTMNSGATAPEWKTPGTGATNINELTDGITDDRSVYLGGNSGINDDGTSNMNVGVGIKSLQENTSGFRNTAIGYSAMSQNTTGEGNVAIGEASLFENRTGSENVAIGSGALFNSLESSNVAMGVGSGKSLANGTNNIFVGSGSGFSLEQGDNNLILGNYRFREVSPGEGANESNKLVVENLNDTDSPLIYGEFDNNLVTINGDLNLKDKTNAGKLSIYEASGSGSNKTSIQAQAMAADYTLTLPADDGDADQVLTTDGSGNLSWATPSGTSQWTTSSSNIYYNSGNVGIGTTSPGYPLSVTGGVLSDWGAVTALLSNAGSETGLQLLNTSTGGQGYALFSTSDASALGGGKFILADWTNQAARLTINSSGNVGIGTNASLDSRLNIASVADDEHGGLRMNLSGNQGWVWGTEVYTPDLSDVGNNVINLTGVSGTAKNSAYWGFKYKGDASDDNALILGLHSVDDVFAINGAGNVGIGTTTPNAGLEVAGSRAQFTGNSTPTSGVGVEIGYDGTRGVITSFDRTGSTYKNLWIDAGKVGIGKGDPAYELDVNGAINGTSVLVNGVPVASSTDTYWNTAGSGKIYYSGGNVGVGTASPVTPLSVNGTLSLLGSSSSYIKNSTTSGREILEIRAGTSTSDGAGINMYGSEDSTNPHAILLYAGGSERLRINSAGNIGIGTINPGSALEIGVAAGSDWSSNIRFTSTGAPNADSRIAVASDGLLFRNFDSTTGTQFSFRDYNDVHIWDLKSGGRSLFNGAVDDETYSVQVGGTNSLRTAGKAIFNGNVGIGTTSPSEKLDVNGSIVAGSNGATEGSLILAGKYVAGDYLNILGSHYADGGTVLGYAVKPKTGAAGYASSTAINIGRSAMKLNGTNISFLTSSEQTTSVGSDVSMSERLTILNNGNVGIGTNTPAAKLDVMGNGNTEWIRISTTAEGTAGAFDIYSSGTGGFKEGTVGFNVNNGITPIVFSQGSTERLRIHNNGYVGIGTTSPVYQLTIDGSEETGVEVRSGGVTKGYLWYDPTGLQFCVGPGSSLNSIMFKNNSVGIGKSPSGTYKLEVDGLVAGVGAYVNASDARLKKDVNPVKNSLKRVMQLRPITFNWKQDEYPDKNLDDRNHIGFIAQEVELLFPQVVHTEKDSMQTKSIAYSDLVPVLTKAIQEQQTTIESQQTQIDDLNQKIEKLTKLVEAIQNK